MCRQIGMTLLHMCEGFSHLNEDLMMSLTSFLCRSREGIKESMHETKGVLLLLVLGPFSSFPNWPIQEATNPLTLLPQCLSRSGTITQQGSVLYLFNCTCLRLSWASWVNVLQFLSSQLGILLPCIYLTQYWKGKDHNLLEWNSAHGINCDLGEPTESIQHSWRESHFWHPWVG